MEKIKQQKLLSMDFDKRRAKKEYQQQYACDIPGGCERSFWFFRKNPKSPAGFIDRIKPVAKTAGGIILGLHVTCRVLPEVLLD
jgi:hypothetical protein